MDYFKGSARNQEAGLILSERAPKTMGVYVENDSFDRLEPEISLVKGGPGNSAGGRGHGQSGAPW